MKNIFNVFMAIAKGKKIEAPAEIKRYIGVAQCHLVAINPNKATLEKLTGRTIEDEPNYIGEADVNGVKVPQVRIDFCFKLDPKYLDNNGNPINTIFHKNIFLVRTPMTKKDGTGVKVIDEYGNTAWVTNDQLTAHEIPMYSNGPASITKNYRPLYRGEETIVEIVRTFLGIPITRIDANQKPLRYSYSSKSWEVVSDASDGLIRFDNIDAFFSGKFNEIQEIPSYQNNTIQVLFGVRSNDGKMYQDIFDTMLRGNVNDFSRIEISLKDAKDNGRYANTEFKVCPFQEYIVTPTDFSKTEAPAADPFSTTEDIF